MKKFFIILAALAACLDVDAQVSSRQERLKEHVYYFASDSLRGRKAGSEDAAKAAEYIVGEFEAAGIKPYFEEGWFDGFKPRGYEGEFKNVVGYIEGADPQLKDQFIVIGAHYDHLGVRNDKVYNGADDNASGTAAVIELARALAPQAGSLGRSVILAAFDAEEIGLYGSSHLAKRLDTLGIDVKLMMSVDMIGWLKEGKTLKLEGTSTIKDGKKVFEREAQEIDLPLKTKGFERSVFTATDTEGFARKGVPTLAVTTGLKSPYHKPGDDAELIDYDGLDKVTGYLETMALECSSDPSFASSGKVAPKHREISKNGVDFSLFGGYSATSLSFDKGCITTSAIPGWNAGAEIQGNFKSFGIWTGVTYMDSRSSYPDAADLYGSTKGSYRRQELMVPVNFVLHTPRSITGGMYIGIGGYWSKALSTEISGIGALPASLTGDTFGWDFICGFQFGRIALDIRAFDDFGSIFSGKDAPSVSRSGSSVNLKYIF